MKRMKSLCCRRRRPNADGFHWSGVWPRALLPRGRTCHQEPRLVFHHKPLHSVPSVAACVAGVHVPLISDGPCWAQRDTGLGVAATVALRLLRGRCVW